MFAALARQSAWTIGSVARVVVRMKKENAVILDEDTKILARLAGLDKALDNFPLDVAVAAQTATAARNGLMALSDAGKEPWPPMRMKGVK